MPPQVKFRSANFFRCSRLQDDDLRFFSGMQLQTLNVSSCPEISDAAMYVLAELKLPVTSLALDMTNVSHIGLDYLKGFQLKHLNLSRCDGVTDYAVSQLQHFPLESLELISCRSLRGDCLSMLPFQTLCSLNLRGCTGMLSNKIAYLAYAEKLESLVLGSTLADDDLEPLKNLALRRLDISSCLHLTDAVFLHLAKMPLEELVIYGEGFVGTSLDVFKGKLRKLIMRDCTSLRPQSVQCLAEFPLHYLDVEGCTSLGNELLSCLGSLRLQYLNVSGLNISDAGLRYLKGLPLEELHIRRTPITGSGFNHLQGSNLRLLNCQRSSVSDNNFHLLSGLPLYDLFLSGCPGVTGAGFGSLSAFRLRSLHLQDCTYLTGQWFHVMAGCRITSIKLTLSDHISAKDLRQLLSVVQGLRQLRVHSKTGHAPFDVVGPDPLAIRNLIAEFPDVVIEI